MADSADSTTSESFPASWTGLSEMDLSRLYEDLIRPIFTFLAEMRISVSHASSAGDMMAVLQTPLSMLYPAAPSYIAAWLLSRFLAHIAAFFPRSPWTLWVSVFSRGRYASRSRYCVREWIAVFFPMLNVVARRTPTGGWQG